MKQLFIALLFIFSCSQKEKAQSISFSGNGNGEGFLSVDKSGRLTINNYYPIMSPEVTIQLVNPSDKTYEGDEMYVTDSSYFILTLKDTSYIFKVSYENKKWKTSEKYKQGFGSESGIKFYGGSSGTWGTRIGLDSVGNALDTQWYDPALVPQTKPIQ